MKTFTNFIFVFACFLFCITLGNVVYCHMYDTDALAAAYRTLFNGGCAVFSTFCALMCSRMA